MPTDHLLRSDASTTQTRPYDRPSHLHGPSGSNAGHQDAYDTIRCGYCGRTFSKTEHLKRHIRSHTKSKPYICDTCGRRFGRQDSLARHGKLHLNTDTQTGGDAGTPSLPVRNGQSENEAASEEGESSPDAGSPRNQLCPQDEEILPNVYVDLDINELPGLDGHPPSLVFESVETGNHANYVPTSFPRPDGELDLWQLLSADVFPGAQSLQPSPGFWDTLGLEHDVFGWDAAFAGPQPGSPSVEAGTVLGPDAETRRLGGHAMLDPRGSPHSLTASAHGEGRGSEAVQEARHMLAMTSSRAANSPQPLTSKWLELCLRTFWSRFVPSFPILHQPTFDVKVTCAPLVLNMVAIGSLYLPGENDRIKGVALWRLVHKAVAGSWDQLLEIKLPHERHKGTQLLLTAVLGQIFAMMSKDSELADTSVIFHGLGFRWAKLTCAEVGPPKDAVRFSDDLDVRWREWATEETRRRAILAHYIIDGCLGTIFGSSPAARHLGNTLHLCPSDASFAASDSAVWQFLEDASEPLGPGETFALVYHSIFDRGHVSWLSEMSTMDKMTVIEGLGSLVMEWGESGGPTVGQIDLPAIVEAMLHLLRNMDTQPDSGHKITAMLRWHCIMIQATEMADRRYHEGIRVGMTPRLRRALLHANAIRSLVKRLTFETASTASFIVPIVILKAKGVFETFLAEPIVASASPPTDINLAHEVDWSSLGPVGIAEVESNSTSPSQAARFVLSAGAALIDGIQVGPQDLYPLTSALAVFSQVWQRQDLA